MFKKYDAYKDSGVEWLGEIPSDWDINSLKRSIEGCVNGLWGADPKANNEDIVVLRVADFDRNKLVIDNSKLTFRNIKKSEIGNRLLKKGDLLIEKSGGGDKTLVGCVVIFNENYKALTSNFVAKMTPKSNVNSYFLNYFFASLYANNINYLSIKQTTGIQNLDTNSYLNEKLALPSLHEQEAIVSFLNQKTSEIDQAIAIKEQQIALLNERKQIVIQKAVTQGLDPNVVMKDSGVEWIGKIPEHWLYEPIKYSLKGIVDCEHKTAPFVDEKEFFVIRTSNVKNGKLVYDDAKYTHEKGYNEWTRRGVPTPGDVLLTREAPAGEACLVPSNQKICLGQRMVWLKINNERVLSQFILYLIYSNVVRTYIDFLSAGSTVLHFNMADIKNIPVLIPPLVEQKSIIQYLDKIESDINHSIEIIKLQIAKLKEYKTTLINDAVTGKIKVA